jgi:hypothetical protein
VGADLGDPVEVAREDGRVVVRGAGIPPSRERQIRQALLSLPNVEVQFPEPGTSSAPGPSEPAVTLQTPAAPTAVQNRLEAQLGGHTQFESFSSQLLDHQEAAMSRIYALRRLASEFPAEVESQLSADNRRLLRDLGREHLDAMTGEAAAIRRAASPVLDVLIGDRQEKATAPVEPYPDWQHAAENIFQSGQQVDSLLAALLGASAQEPAANLPDPEAVPRQFLTALARLQLSVQQCERLLMQ